MADNVGLMDLKRASREVPIGDQKVTMLALSIEAIAHLLVSYPAVKKLFNGGLTGEDFSVANLIAAAPEIAAELIAAGADQPGDKKAIAHVKTLGVATQTLLLEGVIDATLEGGMAPFVARLTRMLGEFGVSLPEDIVSPTGAPGSISPSQ